MFSLSVEILSHPRRFDLAAELYIALQPQAARIGAELAWRRDLPVSDPPSIWPAARQLWLQPTTASHRLVLQEDLEVAPDLLSQVLRQLAVLPSAPICLLLMNNATEVAARQPDQHWLVKNWCWESQALVLPLPWAQRWVAWCDATVPDEDARRRDPNRRLADDNRLGLYCRVHRELIWYCLPSLVEHRRPDLAQSIWFEQAPAARRTLERIQVGRRAVWPWTADPDYPHISWSAGVERPLRSVRQDRVPLRWWLKPEAEYGSG